MGPNLLEREILLDQSHWSRHGNIQKMAGKVGGFREEYFRRLPPWCARLQWRIFGAKEWKNQRKKSEWMQGPVNKIVNKIKYVIGNDFLV